MAHGNKERGKKKSKFENICYLNKCHHNQDKKKDQGDLIKNGN